MIERPFRRLAGMATVVSLGSLFLVSCGDGPTGPTVTTVQVVGEATNAEEALTLLRSLSYDLVLLDIRMPGGTGLEVAAAVTRCETVCWLLPRGS
jgi:CheY-like chemotaxis protein